MKPLATLTRMTPEATRKGAVAGLVALGIMAATTAAVTARPAPDSFADLAERVSPAVVNVSTVQRPGPAFTEGDDQPMPSPFPDGSPFQDFFKRFFEPGGPGFGGPQGSHGQQPEVRGVGSGFIIDPEGHVVTNNHVVAGAEEIKVTLTDGRVLDAELVGRDERTDLALLKVAADAPLPSLEWGDSDAIRVGDWVMAVGNPYGLGGTVTAGIVSARGRDLRGGALNDFLQIDAPINRGNSGGPSFDVDGRVIGINTAIYSPNGGSVGIGFAIPSKVAAKVIAALKEDGTIERGWLGVQIQEVTPDIAAGFKLDAPRGALVASVEPGGPAARAGLRPGDIVTEWNGRQVEALKDLPRLVADTPVESGVTVGLWRDGKALSLEVMTGRMPSRQAAVAPQQGESGAASELALTGTGITLADLDDALRARLGLDAQTEGVLVAAVEPGSLAAEQGIRAGDLVTSVALEPVSDTREAMERFRHLREEGDAVVTLGIRRGAFERFVALRLDDSRKGQLG